MAHEAEDLALNEDNEVYIDARGDLATVSGREAFNQEVRLRTTANLNTIISEHDRETARDLIEIEIRRVAQEMDRLDDVAAIEIVFPEDKANTVEVTVIYDTGEPLTFEEQA